MRISFDTVSHVFHSSHHLPSPRAHPLLLLVVFTTFFGLYKHYLNQTQTHTYTHGLNGVFVFMLEQFEILTRSECEKIGANGQIRKELNVNRSTYIQYMRAVRTILMYLFSLAMFMVQYLWLAVFLIRQGLSVQSK